MPPGARPQLSQGSIRERSSVHSGKRKVLGSLMCSRALWAATLSLTRSTQEPWNSPQCLFLQCTAHKPAVLQWILLLVQSLFTSFPMAGSPTETLLCSPWKHSVGHTLSHSSSLCFRPHCTYMPVCVNTHMHMFVATSYIGLCSYHST